MVRKGSFAEIIIDISHSMIDRAFTYKVPEELADKVYIGCPVKVQFGNIKELRTGYIIDFKEETEFDINKLKTIVSLSEQEFSAESRLIEIAAWMKRRYGSTMSRALRTVLPVKSKAGIRKEQKIRLLCSGEEADDLIEAFQSRRRSAGIRLLEALKKEKELSYSYAIKELKIRSGAVRKLEEEGYIRIEEEDRNYLGHFGSSDTKSHSLNTEQKEAFSIFEKDFRAGIRKTYLLYGITGSGKTEVYMEMIRSVLKAGKQVIVLIPEIGLTYQTLRRFERVFGQRLGIINSSLSAGERYEQFRKALRKETDIMIGPRSALFTPFDNTGLVIIDEEHESSYKNETLPRYDSREVAEKIGKLYKASVVLASATPSVETYKRMKEGEIALLKLSKRANPDALLAETEIVDLRREFTEGNRSIFSRRLKELIEDRLEKKEQIMLFMNRRGYSSFISCRSCGEAIKCRHCDVSLTYHKEGRLRCHYCGFSTDMPSLCPNCSSPYIAGFGIGTQQLESMTKKMFPAARVLRLDTDSAAGKNATRDILKSFSDKQADILIGTQMIVKGHDFSQVSLVGIMAADTSLYVSHYTAAERTFQLITQAAGRAGRAGLPSNVIIQTYKPEHYAIKAAAKQDFDGFYQQETAFRKITYYPPFIHILSIQLSARQEEKLYDFSKKYTENAKKYCALNKAFLIGAIQAPLYKLHDYFRMLVYIKHQDYNKLLEIKERLDKAAAKIEFFQEIGFIYDFV